MKIENVVVISLEDYAEYQELKNKSKGIDYNKLRTGSVVKIKRTGQHCAGIDNIDLNKPVTILLYKTIGFFIKGKFRNVSRIYTTFIQEDKTCHFTCEDEDYITEVISY